MLSALAAIATVTLVGACGDDLVKVEWFRGSSRLAVQTWATEGGYRYAYGWRDRMLDVTCAADALACAPLVAAYFADASCRDFIAASPDPLPPIVSYIDGFEGAGHGLMIDEPFVGPVYAGWRGCVRAGETDPDFHYARAHGFADILAPHLIERVGGLRYAYPDLAFIALADPELIPLAERTGQINIEDGPDRLRTRYLIDAAMPLAAGIHDAELDIPCAPALDPAGERRCLPRLQVALYPESYSDAACTLPIGFPLYRERGFTQVGDLYMAVDSPVDGDVFVRAGTTCLPTGDRELWAPGDVFEPTRFVRMFAEELP